MPRFVPSAALVLSLFMLAASALAAPRPRLSLASQSGPHSRFGLSDAHGRPLCIKSFLGRKRIALLFVPAQPGWHGADVLRTVQQHRAEFVARDLVVWVIAPPQGLLAKQTALPPLFVLHDTNGTFTHAYQAGSGASAFYLIGKDRGIKMARPAFPSLRELFGTIDAMPMRREEMRRRGQSQAAACALCGLGAGVCPSFPPRTNDGRFCSAVATR